MSKNVGIKDFADMLRCVTVTQSSTVTVEGTPVRCMVIL